MSLRHKWQKIAKRDWNEIRDAWFAHIPNFPILGAVPDPGLEHLNPLLVVKLPDMKGAAERVRDVDGIRRNALWEAVFLFHKCAHTNLAAQRLGQQGMHSWCMFNAYHSAYLGAKGILALLGLMLPNLNGNQVAIDLFPEPLKKPKKSVIHAPVLPPFEEFSILRLPLLEQRYLWEAFQHVIRISKVACWDVSIQNEVVGISYDAISPPRNHFLYKARFWPLKDLMSDAALEEMNSLIGTELDTEERGFLFRLSFCVYRLFEQLMQDLGQYSSVIKEQLDGSRFLPDSGLAELARYRTFLSQVASQQGAAQ